jgi:hypothetical protein
MIIYDVHSIVNMSLSNTLTPKNIKCGFLVRRFWPFNTNIFTDEDSSHSAVTDRLLQDNKNLDNFGLSDSHSSNSNLNISSQPSKSGLNTS